MTQWKGHLRRVYWESTASCNLRCIHCRRLDVLDQPSPDELTTVEAENFIDQLSEMGKPVFIFSGGEPLLRPDFFQLAAYAKAAGLPIAVATNGTLVDEVMARQLHETGIYYASVSLDGALRTTHDHFRGNGSYDKTLAGLCYMREAGMKVQINFTVTRQNVAEVEAVYELARREKAVALYLFLLVPVGCGEEIASSHMLSTEEVEHWLKWVAAKDQPGQLPIRAICAPQIYRVEHQLEAESTSAPEGERKGCLAGLHMCFVSHKGDVYPCGYLPTPAGNIRQHSFQAIWEKAPLLQQLRDSSLLTGRCGACDFKDLCGGCRARAFYAHGDLLAEEPYCIYSPPTLKAVAP